MECLTEVFAIQDALHEFKYSDLLSASREFIIAMGYPEKTMNQEPQNIEDFIYFSVPNRLHYSSREMMYLKQISKISYICSLGYWDLITEDRPTNDEIIFIVIDLISPQIDRSDVAFYVARILRKAFNNDTVIIVKNQDCIALCAYIDDQTTGLSEWYDVDCDCERLYPLCGACYSFLSGAHSVGEFFRELVFAFSRDYIRYPETYEYFTNQFLSKIDIDCDDCSNGSSDMRTYQKKYFLELYGFDFVINDDSMIVLLDDDLWTMIDLDDLVVLVNDDSEDDLADNPEIAIKQIDIAQIDASLLADPVKLLSWLEKRDEHG